MFSPSLQKKVQFICTLVFLLWGFLVHLIIPAFVFMTIEDWTYLEGLYFSFTTMTTVGFGDYVAGMYICTFLLHATCKVSVIHLYHAHLHRLIHKLQDTISSMLASVQSTK